MCDGHRDELPIPAVEGSKIGPIRELFKVSYLMRLNRDPVTAIGVRLVCQHPLQEPVSNTGLPFSPEIAHVLLDDEPLVVDDEPRLIPHHGQEGLGTSRHAGRGGVAASAIGHNRNVCVHNDHKVSHWPPDAGLPPLSSPLDLQLRHRRSPSASS